MVRSWFPRASPSLKHFIPTLSNALFTKKVAWSCPGSKNGKNGALQFLIGEKNRKVLFYGF